MSTALLPWFLAGPALGGIMVGFKWATNESLGATGSFVSLNSRIAGKRDKSDVRVWLFIGTLIGGFVSALIAGGFHPTFANGAFDARFGGSLLVKGIVLLGAGALMGYGARTAGGCTSGNGVCGSAQLSLGGIVSTATFMITAMTVAAFVVRL